MIPSNILNPKGCSSIIGEDYGELTKCGDLNAGLCYSCKLNQKAQAQTLLDEKKSELEFLNKHLEYVKSVRREFAGLQNFQYPIQDKIQELQEEIKELEGVING